MWTAACSSSGDPPDAPDTPGPSVVGDAGNADVSVAPGTATIAGSVNGNPFSAAAGAYTIRGTDDPENVVIYVFSDAVKCSDIGATGWDSRVGQRVQALEMKLKSAVPGAFSVVTTPTIAAGEASVNDTFVGPAGPSEQIASGGSIHLDSYAQGMRASGQFDIAFKTESLKGTFDAVFCPGGVEP
jgi:hypothetical protein